MRSPQCTAAPDGDSGARSARDRIGLVPCSDVACSMLELPMCDRCSAGTRSARRLLQPARAVPVRMDYPCARRSLPAGSLATRDGRRSSTRARQRFKRADTSLQARRSLRTRRRLADRSPGSSASCQAAHLRRPQVVGLGLPRWWQPAAVKPAPNAIQPSVSCGRDRVMVAADGAHAPAGAAGAQLLALGDIMRHA